MCYPFQQHPSKGLSDNMTPYLLCIFTLRCLRSGCKERVSHSWTNPWSVQQTV